IFGSPFLLEPLSYRFDSLSFAASIALSIVYIKNIERVRARFFYGVACITGVFCLYQTSINMLAIMSLIPIHIMINNGEDTKSILRKIYLTIIELVFGLFLYAIINKITFNGAYNN
ncbi:glucosyltransferase domain-containing protein, partial [Escherichia coli]|uniref:glucosyltransferase domain-containing protein n=1 Tax=Escherichia coli TaxID=562 RepID=UPI001560A469